MNESEPTLLAIPKGSAKFGEDAHTISIPAGWTCPGAKTCLSRADPKTGKIKDGPDTKIRCFSASLEATFKNVRLSRWRNLGILKNAEKEAELMEVTEVDRLTATLCQSIQKTRPRVKDLRVHVGGDFYSDAYFEAWMRTAKEFGEIGFWAYTKSITSWLKYKHLVPPNFTLTASAGGKFDRLINGIEDAKTAHIVLSYEEAALKQWEIDHDDSLARGQGGDFALLVHGVQPKGSVAAAAIQEMKRRGVEFSYPRKKHETTYIGRGTATAARAG